MSRKHNKQLKFLVQEVTSLFDASEFAPYDPTQEVIFPPELMVNNACGEKRERAAFSSTRRADFKVFTLKLK